MTVRCDSENIKSVMNETVPTAEISNREWLARESPVGVRFGSNYFDFKFSCCQFFNNHLEPNPCHSCPSLLMTEPYGSLTFMLSQSSLIYTFTVFSFAIYPNKCIMVNFWDRNKTFDFEQQFFRIQNFQKTGSIQISASAYQINFYGDRTVFLNDIFALNRKWSRVTL